MRIKLLTIFALLTLVLSQCSPNYSISNLLAGSVQFSAKSGSANSMQKYQYTFSTPFSAVPNVALALQDFSISSMGAHAFYVSPTQINTTSIVFTFAYTTPIWSSIRFNFWASSNSQIQLGYFSNNNLTVSANSAVVTTKIQQAFGTNDNPVVRVFLNGYQSESNTVQIQVSPSNLQGTTLSAKIVLGSASKIVGIWLSWIAFSPVTASFSAYGGSVGKNSFVGSFNSDISSHLYQNSYLLYGLSQISINGQDSLAFNCRISNSFQLSLTSSRNFDSLGVIYIVAGNPPSKLCSACGTNNVAYDNTCLSSCPLGTIANTYKDGGIACLGTAVLSASSGSNSAASINASSTSQNTFKPIIDINTSSTFTTNSSPTSTPSVTSLLTIISAPTPTSAPTTAVSPPTAPTSAPTPPTSAPTSASTPPTSASTPSTSAPTPTCPINAFYNGNQCVCEVGFGYINGKCTVLPIASVVIPVIINPKSSETVPTSPSASFYSSSSSTPTIPVIPYTNSTPSSHVIQPKPTFTNSSSVTCPLNSYDNGLSTCVCNTGYYFSGQGCIQGTPCPANSTRQADGSCKCDAGLTNYNGFCSKCPFGALWSSQSNTCIFVCGQNSIYNTSVGSCVCNPGYGLQDGQCQICPSNYFISNGFCVTCPINSQINPRTNSCDCLPGFFTNQFGICARKCGTNEIYNSNIQSCGCLPGLGRINGVCTICPAGSSASGDGSACAACGDNQQLVGGQCVCNNGYALNSAKVCIICSSLPNGFLINGACSVCPSNLIYDGNQGCICPSGKVLQGSTCVSQCKSDELLDSQGNCYTCGHNQVISNGKCVCINGYTLSSCGICVSSCSGNQFMYQGICATCPLNTVYNAQINGCTCPSGYYKDNYGVCQQLVLKPVDCSAGQYFDSNLGCVACPGQCKTCKSSGQCVTCSLNGYTPNLQGICIPNCGDGLILGGETCDTGLNYSPGCVNCQISSNWTCSGQPSICVSNKPAVTPTPTPINPSNNPGPTPSNNSGNVNLQPLYQSGNATVNSNNVFVTLKTNPTFTFDGPSQMQSFLKSDFPLGQKPTVYCSQRASPNLDTFDCLMIFPSGVPNQTFSVNFSYNYKGKNGAVTVKVDPFIQTNSRNNARKL